MSHHNHNFAGDKGIDVFLVYIIEETYDFFTSASAALLVSDNIL